MPDGGQPLSGLEDPSVDATVHRRLLGTHLLTDVLPAGSYLAIGHPGSDLVSRKTNDGLTDVAKRMTGYQHAFRTLDQVARFFAGLDLVQPGIVRAEEWRPDPGGTADKSVLWCAVGRKR
jgi:hypothetical protein